MDNLTKKQKKSRAFRERRAVPKIAQPDVLDVPDTPDVDQVPSPTPIKRKSDPHDHPAPQPKRTKLQEPAEVPLSTTEDPGRLILFVGNLRYTTSKDAVSQHFSKCNPPPTVRLLTNKDTAKSKGCAFVEFKTRKALQEGLGLHHTTLDGRKLNVELTAGGGGKSTMRVTRIKNRNAELEKQRIKRVKKRKPPTGDEKNDL